MREGTLFEFSSPEAIIAAATALHGMGFSRLEAYTPFPIPELDEKLALRRTRIPRAVFVAASFGCALAFAIIWFTNAVDYPLDVGGRPLDSFPADIPIMFETTVLLGSLTSFVLVFLLSGMPRLHHPVFDVEGFESATIDRFWLGIDDPQPVSETVRERMVALGSGAIRTFGGVS